MKPWIRAVGSIALVFLLSVAIGPVLQADTCSCDIGGGCTFVAKCPGSCSTIINQGQCEINYEGDPCNMVVDCMS
jgi:hypothetical protein